MTDGPYYQIINNDISMYETYIKAGGGSMGKRSAAKLGALHQTIKDNGYQEEPYPYINKCIKDSHNFSVLNDGHHRLSIARTLYGNIKVKILELNI